MGSGKYKCPKSGQKSAVTIIYGYPGETLIQESEKHEIVLGGCVQLEGSPNNECLDCGHRWPGAGNAEGF